MEIDISRSSEREVPISAKRIVAILGTALTLELCRAFGGTTIYIPAAEKRRKGNANYELLAEVIGDDGANSLIAARCDKWPYLYIPHLKCDSRAGCDVELRARFHALLQMGIGRLKVIAELAREFKVSDSHIRNALRTESSDSNNIIRRGPHLSDSPHAGEIDDWRSLTRSARELASCIGVDATIRLCKVLGGTVWKVPKALSVPGRTKFEWLGQQMGQVGAQKLVANYGGQELYVPMLVPTLIKMRNRSIVRDFDRLCKTMSARTAVDHLARSYRLSDRHIWRVLKKTDDI